MTSKEKTLQGILDKAVDNKKVFGTSFCIKHKDDVWCGSSGNLDNQQQYFIASTTKLFITAIILNFKLKGLLEFDDLVGEYLDQETMEGCMYWRVKTTQM